MVVIWIGISIAALVVELITPTALVSIWFAVGGIIAVLLSLLNLPIWVQIAGFAIVSIVSMLVVRPIASRYLRGNTIATNADRCIGEFGVVVKPVSYTHLDVYKRQGFGCVPSRSYGRSYLRNG